MKRLLLMMSLAALCAGCRSTTRPEIKFIEHTTESRAEAKAQAQRYMDAFCDAIRMNDFTQMEKLLPQGVKAKRNGRAMFADMKKWIDGSLGELSTVTYLGEFRKGIVCDYFWKMTFEKPEDKEHGKAAQELDIPYCVRAVNEDGQVKIAGGRFLPF